MCVLFLVNRFQTIILHIVKYKYLKSCSEEFILKNLIRRTSPHGTALITPHSWLVHFKKKAEICLVEMICTGELPALKRHMGWAGH